MKTTTTTTKPAPATKPVKPRKPGLKAGILWAGPSPIDGAPIVCVLTVGSKNSKTGAMAQTWILRSDIHPVDALKTGEDASICGTCPHRPRELGELALSKLYRTCYVATMAPSAVYKAFKQGKYPMLNLEETAELLRARSLRLGSYGDPAMIPLEVWRTVTRNCAITGYTHRWRECDTAYADICMASCETLLDIARATEKGYRVFYASPNPEPRTLDNRVLATCPASKEAGKRTTCANCLSCGGKHIQPNELKPRASLIKIALH